jgi:Flp pilus assembly pilin Flp
MRNRCGLRRQERGVTAVEYALVISFVSLLVVAAAVSLGSGFTVWASSVADEIGTLLS